MKRFLIGVICVLAGVAVVLGVQHNWPQQLMKTWNDATGQHSGQVRKDSDILDGLGTGYGRPRSVVGDEDADRCGLSLTYPALVNCKQGNVAYHDALARNRANLKELGDWQYIVDTANRCRDAQAVGILISNLDITDAQARDGLRSVWGSANVDQMPILPRQHGIINTAERDKMVPFPDATAQVRVVIVPMDANCKPIATSTYGIIADCYNGEWVEFISAPPPGQQVQPPPSGCTINCGPPPAHCTVNCGPPPVCTVNCGPPPVCTINCGPPPCQVNCGPPPCQVNCGPPPCTVNCQPDCTQNPLACKIPSQTPQGPSVPGQEGHVNADPGPGEYQPVTPPTPGPVFTPSPAPPAPTLAPDVTPAPAPVVIQPPDPGVVPTPGTPGSSEGRSDGVVVAPSAFVVERQSEVALAA